MMKFGTPDADDGPGNASMNPGLAGVGVPSELRSSARPSRSRPSSRSRRGFFLPLSPSSSTGASTSPLILRILSRFFLIASPLSVSSCGVPPPELGGSGSGVGAGAGLVGSGFGAGFGAGGVGVVGGAGVGVVGGAGVVGAGGGSTGVPGSWMSSSVLPGGTSTVT